MNMLGRIARRKYIVKPAFQIKYLIITVVVVLLTGIIMYSCLWWGMKKDPELVYLSIDTWNSVFRSYTSNFIIVLAALLIAFGVDSIFIFHRIAGPLFSIERSIKSLATGDLSTVIRIRKGDELKELATSLQQMTDNLRQMVVEDRQIVDEIIKDIDAGKTEGVREKLMKIHGKFKIE
jgi:methyl-accepting chemotaxis protein